MEALEIIEMIRTAEKKTPVRVTVQEKLPCEFTGQSAEVFRDDKVDLPALNGSQHSL